MHTNGMAWYNPDMVAYRDNLLTTVAPARKRMINDLMQGDP
jgi:hypothetical protein